jgi:hypothetical protein
MLYCVFTEDNPPQEENEAPPACKNVTTVLQCVALSVH